MDKRVYLLTIIAFIVGMVELIIGGILDLVANDLGVSLGKAGLLITVFSLVYAIAAPILLVMTSQIERKRLTLFTLFILLFGNVIAVFSPNYTILLVARVISAASGSLLVILSIILASSIVSNQYIGRAVGIVIMGISGSIVLGVPIGLMLGNSLGWRAPFVLISILTILLIMAVHYTMTPINPVPSIPLKQQVATLKSSKLFFAQLTTFFMLAGHITLYAYFTPFLKLSIGLDGTWVSIVYFIYGIAAVVGGGLGGILTDKYDSKRVMLFFISLFSLCMFVIPYTIFAFPLFLATIFLWGICSWTITPAMQSYLIETSPNTAAIQQSLNNSALHFGIAFGSFIGSLVIERAPVEYNATTGALFVILALGAITFSITREQGVELPTPQHNMRKE